MTSRGADERRPDLVVRSRRVVLPGGQAPAAVAVRDGRITGLHPHDAPPDAAERVDLGDVALLPGLVDTHVHVNEPGRTHWEGFASATRAAAAGGVTTIVDMPLNSLPPTVDVAALDVKRRAAGGRCAVDVGFWGGAVPGNAAALRPLHEAGVFGFKCFLSPSGVEEFPPLDDAGLRRAMAEIASFDGLLVVHAEDPALLADPAGPGYADFLGSRPGEAERRAVERVVTLAGETGARVHILHVSSALCLEPLAAARARGVRVTAETCPHYLTLTAEEVPPGGTAFKCCPPIRSAANRDALWRGLAEGVLSCVVSDHSPSTPDLKMPDFARAWGGVSSLQLGLSVVWTEAARRGYGLEHVVRWMAAGPAALAGLTRKGAIEAGRDADLVAFDPDAEHTVDAAALHHRNPVTPYHGRTLRGTVRATWLRGRLTDAGPDGEPGGVLLRRPAPERAEPGPLEQAEPGPSIRERAELGPGAPEPGEPEPSRPEPSAARPCTPSRPGTGRTPA
ncbi:allantoinase AllB [Streptosporangium sandarakinum]|uniref:allantoinase n=1 Tax=Streptosporangium sandarakinum TaxID=1260955 RepID=A0A852UP41_9ACTN|nr:allantoinase AllB [Streptosporangium sandarakinum]NYF38792.1 allantoinase [Streptosporangium sandarakinum]